jgi:hypothetical protein
MARSGIDPRSYDFPELVLPSQIGKSKSLTQLNAAKAAGVPRPKSAAGHYARSISEEKSRAYVRQQQRGLPKMVPEHLRKDFHRYGVPADGPMGIKNMRQVCSYFEFKGYIDGGEYRSVTMAQFMQVFAYVEAKCLDWKLAVEEVNFYHVSTWLIQPATKATHSALFEHIADRQQAPTWFISHWWGEPLVNVVKSIRRHFSTRGLPSHIAYWLCAYANRQDELSADFMDGHRETNFYKAMQLAKFKVLLVLDVASGTSGPATPFKRTWCIFECSMCLEQVTASIDIAVVMPNAKDDVELVCSGLTKFERTSDRYLPGRGMSTKVKREDTFPDEIVRAALAFSIKMSAAGSSQDNRRILNYIAGQEPDADPPREHEKYEELNRRVQGLLSQVFWHRSLAKVKPAQEEARKKFMAHVKHLSRAIASDERRRSLSLCLAGCCLDEDDSVELVAQGLPPNLVSLSLNLQHSGLSDRHLDIIAGLLPKNLQVLSLDLAGCSEISDAGVMDLVQNLNRNVRTLSLGLQRTQVGDFLLKVVEEEPLDSLRERAAARSDKSKMKDPRSRDQQSEDKQNLLECMLRSKPSKEVRERLIQDLANAGQTGDRLEMNRRREEEEPKKEQPKKEQPQKERTSDSTGYLLKNPFVQSACEGLSTQN